MTTSQHARPGDEQPRRLGPAAGATLLLDLPFTEGDLVAVRGAVAAHADRGGLPAARVPALVLIGYELATNAVRHGGGQGRLRLWVDATAMHCQVSDDGPGLPDPHRAAPRRPELGAATGRGLWLVLKFADHLHLDNLTLDNGAGGATVTATLNLPAPA
jgi:anti-sigma regulatory factor (Ser/Thr protein kinase)